MNQAINRNIVTFYVPKLLLNNDLSYGLLTWTLHVLNKIFICISHPFWREGPISSPLEITWEQWQTSDFQKSGMFPAKCSRTLLDSKMHVQEIATLADDLFSKERSLSNGHTPDGYLLQRTSVNTLQAPVSKLTGTDGDSFNKLLLPRGRPY